MRIPETKIAEIASAADIVNVISNYVDLKKAGKDYRGVCPFHGDKDPSFYVSPSKNIFHCFGCATGGSVFNFVMKIENVSFIEAARILAERYGVQLVLESRTGRSDEPKEKIYKALEVAHGLFKSTLAGRSDARNYLLDRGLTDSWIETLGLGFAEDSWDQAQKKLIGAGVSAAEAVSAGLLKQRSGGGYYDYFRSRIMIPIYDLNSRLIAFGGRIFGEGDPKYLNSPESVIFRKKYTLFGLDGAREAIRKTGRAIIVEGYFDQIALRINGLENVVAPLGTALGTAQIRLIKRFTDRMTVIFDGDEAGLRALKRSIPLFVSEAVDADCVVLTQDKDPDEAIRRLGPQGFRDLLDNALPMIDFFLDSLGRQYDFTTIKGRNQGVEECTDLLRRIADSTERDYLIERMSSRIKVKEDRLRKVLEANQSSRSLKNESEAPAKHGMSLFEFPAHERNVIRGMLMKEGFISRVVESGVIKDIEHPRLAQIARMVVDFSQTRGNFDCQDFVRSLEDQDQASLVASWLQPRPEEDDLRPEHDGDLVIDQSLDAIRQKKMEKRKIEIIDRMKKCDPSDSEYGDLAHELLTLGRRLKK